MTVTSETEQTVATALRLGWAVAEVRGRTWPDGPRPTATSLPRVPGNVLPLRSQRTGSASRRESVKTLVSLTRQIGLEGAEEFEAGLATVLPPFAPEGGESLADDATPRRRH